MAEPVRKKKRTKKPLEPIGWREWIILPDLGIDHIKAKVDTGAASSSLHVYHIEYEQREHDLWVHFRVHPLQRSTKETVYSKALLVDRRWVKSSGGHRTFRPVIRTPVRIGERTFPIEVTLANRDAMGFRMLIGRQALRKRFLVDSGRSYLINPAPPAAQPPG
jgi:hypothetical protein